MKKSLQSSEWIITASLIVILVSLYGFSHLHRHRKNSLLTAVQAVAETVEISISGEVSKPGQYQVVLGSRLGDVVRKSRPKRFANLGCLDLDSPVASDLELIIPRMDQISVRVVGAVFEDVDLELAAGSRICDLKSKVHLKKEADLKFMKRRRLLKNGETLIIPHRQDPLPAKQTLDDKSASDL